MIQPMNRTVIKLGVISFFADIASEMLYPITPLFLTSVLGASMASVGLIEGVAEAISSLLKTYCGQWSDRIGKRKPFIAIGYFLAALSRPLIGFAHSWVDVLVARGLDRVGKGLRTAPRDALIADSVVPKERGAAFGWHRGLDTMGAAVGPLITISLVTASAESMRQIYFWSLIPGLAAVFLALTIHESQKVMAPLLPAEPLSEPILKRFTTFLAGFSFRLKEMNPEFKKYLWGWTLFSLANSSDAFLLMKAQAMGVSLKVIILQYCAFNLVYALTAPYLGKLSDRVPRQYLLIFGMAVFAFVYFGFGKATEVWQFWILFLFYGLYMGATEGVGRAMAVDYCPPHLKATALGVVGTVTGLAAIVGSTSTGVIWDRFGSQMPFYLSAALTLIALGIMASLSQKKT